MYMKWANKPNQPNNGMPKARRGRRFVEETNIDLLFIFFG